MLLNRPPSLARAFGRSSCAKQPAVSGRFPRRKHSFLFSRAHSCLSTGRGGQHPQSPLSRITARFDLRRGSRERSIHIVLRVCAGGLRIALRCGAFRRRPERCWPDGACRRLYRHRNGHSYADLPAGRFRGLDISGLNFAAPEKLGANIQALFFGLLYSADAYVFGKQPLETETILHLARLFGWALGVTTIILNFRRLLRYWRRSLPSAALRIDSCSYP